MEAKHIKKEIRDLVDLISEQVKQVDTREENVPQVHIDMLRQQTLRLYEAIHKLDKWRNKMDFIPVSDEVKAGISEKNGGQTKISVPQDEEGLTNTLHENLSEISELSADISEKTIKKIKPEKNIHEKHTIRSINEKYANTMVTLEENLKVQKNSCVADKIQQGRIENLQTAIGLNDKFLLIQELFEGNKDYYLEVIKMFDSFTLQEKATAFLSALQAKYNWNKQSPAYRKLEEFVEKRY